MEQVQKIFAQLVGAVSYVHAQNCVHRDLKLENILLDKNEDVKLVDFGFTREYEGRTNHLQTFCGTVCYAAPEMLKGEKYAGEKVDVWSLGIILYALLAGELPFDDDDDMVTKQKILNTEPKYPDSFPPDATNLLGKLLSKRPLVRITLADILAHSFLAQHAPAQQAILKITRPAPFTSDLEKNTLQRMRSAGVNIDKVIEHVLSQRCDALAGWWALLIEKEERKEKRRERKRKEKEQEVKSMRRISATSNRRISTLYDLDEAGERSENRGRKERRSLMTRKSLVSWKLITNRNLAISFVDLPQLPEGTAVHSPQTSRPPPISKDGIRSASSSQQRPPPPPKERRRSRQSGQFLVPPNADFSVTGQAGLSKRRAPRRHTNIFINQLSTLKHWFVESAKRAKSPIHKSENSPKTTPVKSNPEAHISYGKPPQLPILETVVKPVEPSLDRPTLTPKARYPAPRASISPAPPTPLSASYRRSSGLRGRKSTSSSVSSIRSLHRAHHSKASSTSSANSITSSAISKPPPNARSPHSSVKVLPATPIGSAFPSNVRLVRTTPPPLTLNSPMRNDSLAGPMPSPGLVFAKRRKTPFRGPTLHINSSLSGGSGSRSRDSSTGGQNQGLPRDHLPGMTEEDEEEEEIEEVEAFSPIGPDDTEVRLDDTGVEQTS